MPSFKPLFISTRRLNIYRTSTFCLPGCLPDEANQQTGQPLRQGWKNLGLKKSF